MIKKVAILIPTYRPEPYIEECLDSIENQTSKENLKVYICLNGSEKHYFIYLDRILKNYTFNYELIESASSGVSKARNSLLNIATEEFICFIDDDDIISDNYIEELLAVTNSQTMGISNTLLFTKNISRTAPSFMSQSYTRIEQVERSKFKSRKYYSSPCAKLIHINMIKSTRFNENLRTGEDSLFMAEISKNIMVVKKTKNECYYYIRRREGSLTRSKVNKKEELSRIFYLKLKFLIMLFDKEYNKTFILSRIVATILQIRNIFK